MAKEKQEAEKSNEKFPTLATILLVIGVAWLLNDTGIFFIKIPWVPLILVVVAIGMIINRYK
jgi:hypothetical protein